MGIQWNHTPNKMMKSILIAALVAAVYAEADADAYYNGLGFGYTGYGYSGLRYNNGYSLYNRGVYGARPYSFGAYRALYKRSADAEPEAEADADAYYYNNYGYGYAPLAARSYAYAPRVASYSAVSPYSYGYSHYNTLGLRSFYKRSADAEPEADADAYYGTYGYGLGYAAAAPLAVRSYSYAPRVASYSAVSPYSYGYSHYNTLGYRGLYKRSADAEPEADAYYGAYGYAAPVASYGYAAAHPVVSSYSYAPRVASYSPYSYGYRAYGYGW